MAEDLEDYDLNPTRPGPSVNEGFQDKAGVYPQAEYHGDSGINVQAREATSNIRKLAGKRGPRVASRVAQTSGRVLSEPLRDSQSQYPYNAATFSASGHKFEIDDTPGSERINIEHRSGTKVEMFSDGSVTRRSIGNDYEVVLGDKELVVRGQVTIVVESNADLRVQGDVNMQVDGDYNQLVQGNYNLEVQGNENRRVHGNSNARITGGQLDETRGNVVRRTFGNLRERTLGDADYELGGSWTTTVEGEVHFRSYGEIQASFYGGYVTLNGEDKDGNNGDGSITAGTGYVTTLYGEDGYLGTDLHVGGSAYVATDVHSPAFEGLAKRSTYAVTAGAAPTGTAVPASANPSTPTDPTAAPASEETVIDVTGTSDEFILDLDRQPVTGYNKRYLNTGEVVARARNKKLRTDEAWLQDQLDSGAITDSITNGIPSRIVRTGGVSRISRGKSQTPYLLPDRKLLRVQTIPANIKITGSISKSTRLSPHYKVSAMLGADALSAQLKAQRGLSATQVANNMQLVAYNVLELLRNKYNDTWIISEGFYNLLENEKIDSSSITDEMSQGLGVGIQFPTQPNEFYYEVACWIRNNLVFDKLVLSYIDYDPSGVNEPTLLITVKPGDNAKSVSTEFNHTLVVDDIAELA